MSTLNLDGIKSIEGKDVKLKYVDCTKSFEPLLLGRFDYLWVDLIRIGTRGISSYEWNAVQGLIYLDVLLSIPQWQITLSNLPNHFILEFALESLDYTDDYSGEIAESNPMPLALGNCCVYDKAFTSYKPKNKVVFVTKWGGQAEFIWGLDGKKWV